MARVKRVAYAAPFRWLRDGFLDFVGTLFPCLLYGWGVAFVSYAIWSALIHSNLAFWALSLSCGFVFVAPMLAMGLYQAGRTIEEGGRVTLGQMLFVRGAVRGDVFYLGLALLLIYLLWGRVAQIVYGLSTYQLHKTVPDLVEFALKAPEGNAMLVVGGVVGGVMAFFTFSLTVVSAPMLLDQKSNVFEAMFTSLRAVSLNFGPLLFWALLIVSLLILCAGTAWLGLILVFPWLGLASWRAYRDLVE
jgi:uncharacterized membrane protein